jgi:hypothetical protein
MQAFELALKNPGVIVHYRGGLDIDQLLSTGAMLGPYRKPRPRRSVWAKLMEFFNV